MGNYNLEAERIKHLQDLTNNVYGKIWEGPKKGKLIREQNGKIYYVEKNDQGQIIHSEEITSADLAVIHKMAAEKKESADKADEFVQNERENEKQKEEAEEAIQRVEQKEQQKLEAAKHDKEKEKLIKALIEEVNDDYDQTKMRDSMALKTIRDFDRLQDVLSELQTPGLAQKYLRQLTFGTNPRSGHFDPYKVIEKLSEKVSSDPAYYQEKDYKRAQIEAKKRLDRLGFFGKMTRIGEMKKVEKMGATPGITQIEDKTAAMDALYQDGNIIYEYQEINPMEAEKLSEIANSVAGEGISTEGLNGKSR